MNPYLEQEAAWQDFHQRWIALAADLLGAQLLPRYFVKVEERLYVHELEEPHRFLGRADIAVAQGNRVDGGRASTQLLEAPAQVELPAVDVEHQSYLEVRDRSHRNLVTVLELLSPTNKRPGKDRDQYLMKREQLLASQAHFVEIDLLRGGPRMPFVNLAPCDYYAMASRVEKRWQADLWPIGLRERLPEIWIPLREADPPVRLDLQQTLHRLYDAAGYELYIYQTEPEPLLSPEDAAWAHQFIPRGSTASGLA
jgi:hypothetical protein